MITPVSPEPAVSSVSAVADYRSRPAMGERTVLPDSTPTARENPTANDDSRFPQPDRQPQPLPEAPKKDSSTIFAAAVIAGALSPTPKTMEEVMLRIGTSTIPAESEARLKDLMV